VRRSLILILGVAVIAGGTAVGLFYGLALAAAPALAGTWKVTLFPPTGAEMNLWLVQVEAKKGELAAKIIAAPNDEQKQVKVTQVDADDKTLRLQVQVDAEGGPINVRLTAYFPEKEVNPKILRGVMTFPGQQLFAQLERTEAKEMDPESAQDEGVSALMLRALKSRNPKDQEKRLEEVIASAGDKPAAYFAGLALVNLLTKAGASEEDLRKQAEAAVKVAAAYGPDMRRSAVAEVARQLNSSDKPLPIAVEFARNAEQGLTDSDSHEAAASVLKTLVAALRKSGKAQEAGPFQARLEKIEDALDKAFLKDAVPFKPKAYGGRAGDDNRVLLVELFTGAQCAPCVAADVAFDALLQTYKPLDVVFLQYHLHVPGPDPLTNADSEKRSDYYDIEGTPTFYLNGQTGPVAAGSRQSSRQGYARLEAKINEELKSETKTKLKLTAQRTGDKIDLTAEVSGLESLGDKVRLRFVVVEEVVRYLGRNGQRLHHHVVRSFPGGVEGVKLDKPASKHTASVSIAELAKSLDNYLTTANTKRPFIDDERPLNLKHLKIVAFIQNDDGKQVLQAAQVDVEDAK
jgi:hypothetical protein